MGARKSADTQPVESDDEFEDLDQLESEDDEPLSATQKARLPKGPTSGALKPPRGMQMNTKEIHLRYHQGFLDLNPAYQRDVVWPHAKQQGLISSLFLNYYIPPIILCLTVREEDGETIYTAIDGKQRCTSVISFIEGTIPFIGADKVKYWYRSPGPGRSGKLLPDNLKRRFDMMQLTTVEYDDIDDEVQRDIFQRVQLGVALSSAEKLQAIASPYTTWLGELLKKYVFQDGTLKDLITWDTTRGKPFQSFASIAIWCQDPSAIAALSPSKYHAYLDRQDPPDAAFRRRFEKAISLLVNLATNHYEGVFDLGLIKGKKSKFVSPVELWFIGYIIYSRMGHSSLNGLAETIREMRQYLRTHEKDLFTNSKVINLVLAWLKEQPIVKPQDNEVVAAVEWEHHDDPSDLQNISRKRRREERELETDPDYHGGPVARGSKSAAAENTRSKAPAPAKKHSSASTAGKAPSPKVAKTNGASSSASTSAAPPRVKTEPGVNPTASVASQAPATAPTQQQSYGWGRPAPSSMDAPMGTPQLAPTFGQLSPAVQSAPPPSGPSYGGSGLDPRRQGYSSQPPPPVQRGQQQQNQQYYSDGQSQFHPQVYGGQYGYQQG